MQGKRTDDIPVHELQPGNYCRLVNGTGGVSWYGMTPNGLLCNLTGHAVTEHEDGSITVAPSILVNGMPVRDGPTCGEPPTRWHGYLERGFWRED